MIKALKIVMATLALTSTMAAAQEQKPQSPKEAHIQWNQAINAKDANWLCALYTNDSVMQRPDGTAAIGFDQVCKDLKSLIAITKSADLKTVFVLEGEDIAILRSSYTLVISAQDGSKQELKGDGIEVVQKQKDGSWLFLADHPTGAN